MTEEQLIALVGRMAVQIETLRLQLIEAQRQLAEAPKPVEPQEPQRTPL